ncbi:HesB-like protein [Proteiniclasticum sp.]|uniref:HesB-like protein n=1 Tax=Proteiniclasticum sp. TaxID=2053595 RepID=UPI0028A00C25|nr:HesB-like protein [Proteiniclasticum sp.]
METLSKELLTMSDVAYEEFLNFLRSNNVEKNNIRISLAGYACSGPRFGLMVDEKKDGDMEIAIKDLTFYVESELYNEFEGFQILSTEENMGQGMVLRPNKVTESDCGSCSSC